MKRTLKPKREGRSKTRRMVNIHKAKTELSRLIGEVIVGEVVVIAKAGKPVAKLIPFQKTTRIRKPGTAKGKVWIASDFNAPLPEKILRSFQG